LTLDSTVPPVAPPPFPAPAARRGNAIWLLELIPLGFGIFLGREMAYQMSIPGNELGGIGPFILAFFMGVIVGVIGLVLAVMRRGRPAAMAFAAAAVLVMGTIGAFKVATALGATAPNLGLTYVAPVVTHSTGTTTVALIGNSEFNAVADAQASCASIDDSTVIGSIETLNAGELRGGTLRATVSIEDRVNARISLFIDGADVPAGEPQPFWDGAIALHDVAADGATGTAEFTNVAQAGADAGKGPAPTGSSWPATLSGSMHWTCRP
jgi:hypothetical protein